MPQGGEKNLLGAPTALLVYFAPENWKVTLRSSDNLYFRVSVNPNSSDKTIGDVQQCHCAYHAVALFSPGPLAMHPIPDPDWALL